jgi:hypothetical protein
MGQLYRAPCLPLTTSHQPQPHTGITPCQLLGGPAGKKAGCALNANANNPRFVPTSCLLLLQQGPRPRYPHPLRRPGGGGVWGVWGPFRFSGAVGYVWARPARGHAQLSLSRLLAGPLPPEQLRFRRQQAVPAGLPPPPPTPSPPPPFPLHGAAAPHSTSQLVAQYTADAVCSRGCALARRSPLGSTSPSLLIAWLYITTARV